MNKFRFIFILILAGIFYAYKEMKNSLKKIPESTETSYEQNPGQKSSSTNNNRASVANKTQGYENFYYILIDRFHDGEDDNNGKIVDTYNQTGYHGGDFAGISNKLRYIKKLGVTTIILSNPFMQTKKPTIHNDNVLGEEFKIYPFTGYSTTSLEKLNPLYGSKEDLKNLVASAHKLDLKVLISLDPVYLSNSTRYTSEFSGIIAKDAPQCTSHDPKMFLTCTPSGYVRFNHDSKSFKQFFKSTIDRLIQTTNIDGFLIRSSRNIGEQMMNSLDQMVLGYSIKNPNFNIIYDYWIDDHQHFRNRFNKKSYGFQIQSRPSDLTAGLINKQLKLDEYLSYYAEISQDPKRLKQITELAPFGGVSFFKLYRGDINKALVHSALILFNNLNVYINYGEENVIGRERFPYDSPDMRFKEHSRITKVLSRILKRRLRNKIFMQAQIKVLYREGDFFIFEKTFAGRNIGFLAVNLSDNDKVYYHELTNELQSNNGVDLVENSSIELVDNGITFSVAPMSAQFIVF